MPLGPDGGIQLYTQSGTHLVVDVAGWFTDASAPERRSGLFVPVSLNRVMDTRFGLRPAAGQTVTLSLAGAGGIPAGVAAVVANVTATKANDAGYVTVYPNGDAAPLASNLNVGQPGRPARTSSSPGRRRRLGALFTSAARFTSSPTSSATSPKQLAALAENCSAPPPADPTFCSGQQTSLSLCAPPGCAR